MQKVLLLFLSVSVLLSCSKDDGNSEEPPQNDVAFSSLVISEITGNSAKVSIAIVSSSETITERGVVYGTSSNPTTDDNKVALGSGIGEFQSTISGLDSETTYYVRGYSVTSFGTSYSSENTFITQGDCGGNVFNGDVTLRSQTEVNDFGANGYCGINGFLFLKNEDSNDPILDLSSLITITEVASLGIADCHNLQSLEGLNNLHTSPGGVSLRYNYLLESLEPLSSIVGEAGVIQVIFCSQLVNLNGLEGITSLTLPVIEGQSIDAIIISNNQNLKSISSLSNIVAAPRGIHIIDNPELESLSGLENISILNEDGARISIQENNQLVNLNGLEGLVEVGGLQISSNSSMLDLEGLNNLQIVNDYFFIFGNYNLNNLNGLEGLSTVNSELSISLNKSLYDFCGINNLIFNGTINGDFLTQGNAYNPTYQDMLDGNCSQ